MNDTRQKRINYLLSRCIEEGDCLMWTGYVSKDNLPIFSENRVKKSARKKLFEAVNNVALNHRQIVRTTCAEPMCMNPAHMKVMDVAAVRKQDGKRGRYSTPVMQINRTRTSRARSKLTMEDVREIRQSTLSLSNLAAQYGVDKSTIGNIKRGNTWADTANPFMGMLSQLIAANDSGRKRA